MNYQYAFLYYLGAFILQSTVLKHVAIFGVNPDLLMVLTIVFAFLFPENYAAVYAILFGAMQDICFSPIVGASALGYFLVSIFVTEVKRFVYRDNLIAILFLVAVSTAMYGCLYWGTLRIFEGNYAFMRMAVKLPILIGYNCALVLLLQKTFVKRVIRYRGDRYI